MRITLCIITASVMAASVLGYDFVDQSGPLAGREQYTNSKNGTFPSSSEVSQPNPEFGAFEVKETNKDGKITQWYQHFVDNEGKEIISIVRQGIGKAPYESIQFLKHLSYNQDGNVSETWEFSGDGTLLKHVVYRYTPDGKWIGGDDYDGNGKLLGHEAIPPEAHMYGEKKKK